jgi:hypothetical protein
VAQLLLLSGAPDHEAQLAGMNLRLEYFHDALRAGEQLRRSATLNDPPNAPGTDDYFRRVRVLRDRLINEAKWSRLNLEGLPLVVNPGRTMAIGVLLGDNQTGWVGNYHPRNVRAMGEKKVKLVAQNQQLAMIPRSAAHDEVDIEEADLSKVRTWFFLTKRRIIADKVIVSNELSEAAETTKNGYVKRWARRIPFPDVVFEAVVPYDGGSASSGYEVAVDEK